MTLLAGHTGNAQGSKPCTVEVRCSKADSAQAYIEKGQKCEQELANEQKINRNKDAIIQEKDQTITIILKDNKEQAETIIDDKKRIKRKNWKIVGSTALNILLLALIF